jgi:hypothetical protein
MVAQHRTEQLQLGWLSATPAFKVQCCLMCRKLGFPTGTSKGHGELRLTADYIHIAQDMSPGQIAANASFT